MCAPSSRCPITQVMKENKPLVCPMCNAPVKPTEPVGHPRRIAVSPTYDAGSGSVRGSHAQYRDQLRELK